MATTSAAERVAHDRALDALDAEDVEDVEPMLRGLVAAPIQRHDVSGLLIGTWARRHQLRLADALYVQLAASRDLPSVTTDRRLHAARSADVVVA